MKKSKVTAKVTKFLYRKEDYGLTFRYQYEVQPGYGDTADLISVLKWAETAEPRKSVAAKAKRRRADR